MVFSFSLTLNLEVQRHDRVEVEKRLMGKYSKFRKASSRGAYGHDPFLSVFEEHRLDSTTTDIKTALFIL